MHFQELRTGELYIFRHLHLFIKLKIVLLKKKCKTVSRKRDVLSRFSLGSRIYVVLLHFSFVKMSFPTLGKLYLTHYTSFICFTHDTLKNLHFLRSNK